MNWFKKLFGEGKIRFEFETADGRKGTGKMPYIGQYIEADAIAAIREQMLVKHGVYLTNVKIVAYST